MNNLSWLLYAADVLPKLTYLPHIFAVILVVMWALLPPKGEEQFGERHVGPFMGWCHVSPYLPYLFVLYCISFLIPAAQTLYLIAASEAGEAVAFSVEGKEILEELRLLLKAQIETLRQ